MFTPDPCTRSKLATLFPTLVTVCACSPLHQVQASSLVANSCYRVCMLTLHQVQVSKALEWLDALPPSSSRLDQPDLIGRVRSAWLAVPFYVSRSVVV